ncbi:MAG: hypothetical protein DRP09_12185 [Candidatus Thorarchaeota archaeon]|nr:MAG: hypothetical protein DRP09_12185 [Candidatus Thorarchaeota archaeon]
MVVTTLVNLVITINGKTEVGEATQEVIDKMKEVMKQSLIAAGEKHLEKVRENIKFGYRLGFPLISVQYALSLMPKESLAGLTYKEMVEKAKEFAMSRDGMVLTGRLLNGLMLGTIKEARNTVLMSIVSTAPYSQNLEEGILFGRYRAGRSRPFFTEPLQLHTIPALIAEIKKRSKGEEW